ncbi:hypothetical protein [Anoxybacillus sp. PDR2]|uniref:hypothetical protein n=1 Tax=Anoxybacillaceae TaxID=3120669 RepID=UPI0013190B28|nr:hypothetical protein [Anoxybacillus sp. PDR2]QHC04707.1 hypothetical protein GRQ40_12640 [Anoxybacillus sp. PDR2]
MEKSKNNFIKIPKSLLDLGVDEVYIYAIVGKGSLIDGTTVLYMPQLLEMLGVSNRTENRNKMKKALSNLSIALRLNFYSDFRMQNNVAVEEMKSSQHYYVKVPEVKDWFIKVYVKDLNKLLFIDIKESKAKLLLQYLYILGMINAKANERRICYPNIEEIAEAIGFNPKTVMKYNEILKEHELIYFETVSLNEISKNIYSRWSEKEDVIEATAEAKVTGYISKERKKKLETSVETKKEPVSKPPKQKCASTDIDPSILSVLEFFVKGGLVLHQGTKAKIDEAIQICGLDNFKIVVKEMESKCRNSMPEKYWAGYFSKNVILEARRRKDTVEAQKRANEKLMNERVIESFDYVKAYRESFMQRKEKEDKINKDIVKFFPQLIEEKEKPKEEWLKALGL